MKLLLHICCAPCTIYPLKVLRQEGHETDGFFYNPNIHPYLEYKKRLDTLKEYARAEKFKVMNSGEYPMEEFLRNVSFQETERCRYCYYDRLDFTARIARADNYDAFTTTLLYSKFQKHEMIEAIGWAVARKHGLMFHYRDFREGWTEGVKISKEMEMYRQPYCGCIYSEKERFYKAPSIYRNKGS